MVFISCSLSVIISYRETANNSKTTERKAGHTMTYRETTVILKDRRMLSIRDAMAYCSLGRNKTYELCDQIGALRKLGKRVLIDKRVLDAYFDKMGIA